MGAKDRRVLPGYSVMKLATLDPAETAKRLVPSDGISRDMPGVSLVAKKLSQ